MSPAQHAPVEYSHVPILTNDYLGFQDNLANIVIILLVE